MKPKKTAVQKKSDRFTWDQPGQLVTVVPGNVAPADISPKPPRKPTPHPRPDCTKSWQTQSHKPAPILVVAFRCELCIIPSIPSKQFPQT
jgi:hypothetical protein